MDNYKTIEVGVRIKLNDALLSAFIEHLHGVKAGSIREDIPWAEAQIERAENNDPDPQELMSFIMTSPGQFESVDGVTFGDWVDWDSGE